MEPFDPTLETECVGCGKLATKYCEGWDRSGGTKSNRHGTFTMSSQCGYPVCETCVHLGYRNHVPAKKPGRDGRALKLRRVQHGIWDSADGRFRFERWEACGNWFVFEASPHPEDKGAPRDGFYDEPSFGRRFATLTEAVEYADLFAKPKKETQ